VTGEPVRTPPEPSPLVTIGVPVFNGAQYLRGALDSAVGQDYSNVEIVIADNDSTDATPEICREFAERGAPVRVVRNGTNIGLVKNYLKVLSEARGKYFTWLAADDVLDHPEYLRRCVAVMERAPDVVLCASSMSILDYDWPGSVATAVFPSIHEDRDWREARLEFFRLPYREDLHFAFYGVFRREALLGMPLMERRYRGRAVVLDMEYPLLAALGLRGRIVAVPEVLRSYRCREESAGFLAHEQSSALGLTYLSLRTKLTVLRIALTNGLPPLDRARAIRTAMGNFTRSTSRVKPLKGEIKLLRRACAERLEQIYRLTAKMERNGEKLKKLRAGVEEERARVAALQATVNAQQRRIRELEQQLARRAAPGPPLSAAGGAAVDPDRGGAWD
jgi:glycosyltransferase involved in cell wall biosynthesis